MKKEAILNVYRVGYHPNDKPDMPFASFSIPKNLIHKDNMYGCHTITLSSDLGFTKFYIDNVEKEIGVVNLNPLGRGGDFIAFPVVGDMGFIVPAEQAVSFQK